MKVDFVNNINVIVGTNGSGKTTILNGIAIALVGFLNGLDAVKSREIIIEEIDLHLHPKWQRHIIEDLKTVFLKAQFIVTTHSPNIITTVQKENVIIIDDCKVVEKTPFTYGRDINSILYDIMDVEEISKINIPPESLKSTQE